MAREDYASMMIFIVLMVVAIFYVGYRQEMAVQVSLDQWEECMDRTGSVRVCQIEIEMEDNNQ